MNKKAIAGLILVIVVILVVMFVTKSKKSQTTADTETIKIGAVLGLSGYAATDSLNVKRGMDLAVEDLAKKGVKVEINYQDDKTDPKQTVSAVQYLLSTYKPQAIMGPIWSYLEDAATPSITQAKVVAYAPADTSEFTTGSPYIFHGAIKNEKSAPAVSKWLKDNGINSVAIIVSKDGWGTSVADAFRKGAKDAGVTVVLEDALLSDANVTTVIAADITKAKSLKAGAILFTGYDEGATILAKKRTELGFQVPVLVNGQMYPQLLSAGTVSKEQLKSVYFLSNRTSEEFSSKFQQKYGNAPGNYADRGYDGVMLLVDGIQKAGSSDSLATYLRASGYDGYAAKYVFDEKGDITTGDWISSPVIQ